MERLPEWASNIHPMVVHGHGDILTPGTVGLRLEGTGTVALPRLSASALCTH